MSILPVCPGVRMKVGVLVCIVRDKIGNLRVLCGSVCVCDIFTYYSIEKYFLL